MRAYQTVADPEYNRVTIVSNARRGNWSGVTAACEVLSPELLGVISSTCNVGSISRSLLHSGWQLSKLVKAILVSYGRQ